jgi:hypothetical protein
MRRIQTHSASIPEVSEDSKGLLLTEPGPSAGACELDCVGMRQWRPRDRAA